jgi:hypothetical protein
MSKLNYKLQAQNITPIKSSEYTITTYHEDKDYEKLENQIYRDGSRKL